MHAKTNEYGVRSIEAQSFDRTPAPMHSAASARAKGAAKIDHAKIALRCTGLSRGGA
jgi:hypothetical protein